MTTTIYFFVGDARVWWWHAHDYTAVLDINLGDHDCAAICQYLRERGIPFLFHTGYSEPLNGWNVPLVKKPASSQEMTDAVERLCGDPENSLSGFRCSVGNDRPAVCRKPDRAEIARLKLANTVLSFPIEEITDAEQIKNSSLQIVALGKSKSI